MKSSPLAKPDGMSSQSESKSEWTETSKVPTNEAPRIDPEDELDEEDIENFLEECYTLLGQVKELRMKPQLRTDIDNLYKRLERAQSWYLYH